MRFLFDTNAAINLLSGKIVDPLPEGQYGMSIISEIELLSYPSLTSEEEQAIHTLIRKVERLTLDNAIRDQAIALRRGHNLKLPDAVIAATAMVWKSTLFTNDQRLHQVPGLTAITLNIKTPEH
ncbi:MAG: type II toxin-antitoxin system VapC family toxin [Magnetococcus sp. DMHC-1]